MKNRIRETLYNVKHSMVKKHYDITNKRFTKEQRKRLKNDSFSILASNCIGGWIYHRLGKQFLSPTINMWFYQKDFLKFVQNLSYYLEQELEFVDSDKDYPVAKLYDINLYFLHYSNEEEARLAWDRRKKRIDFDNLYIIMYDRDGLDDNDYKEFARINCKKKVILSENDNKNYPFFICIKKNKDKAYLDKDKYGIMTFERQWDYVEWLNT